MKNIYDTEMINQLEIAKYQRQQYLISQGKLYVT